ncbi:Cu(2+)-transporting P-type ATPase CCC2 [Aspergillus clavatus NRRL 1]|uniref:P-type Cu(+) transporter n=1 Tax=Aspergillus clavatus (strain ATCC 1007 / CBS 513.65 / DSM 816 / NCTC 3887 / NRRL 1 / QM 1276 / 107) TaxID=344612 RepID=A1CII4_ASPCL|nr:copper-transporting ATPase, putative [Aspergillus clavatus NRRL 1]EAW10689.1 copper-transporting ATPase, putative [Aspergillus clavatus NRRL 1]
MAAYDLLRADDKDIPAGRSPAHMATTTVKVDGMTCGACTSAVEGAFKDVEGVGEVSVSLMMGRAVVHHDPTLVPAEQIAEKIEDCGFDAAIISTDSLTIQADTSGVLQGSGPQFSTTTLAIEGMTCGACTSAVEGGLKEVAGVRSINVSLLSERAVVEHDASVVTPEKLADIIEDRGFGAKVLDTLTLQNGPQGSLESTGNLPHLMITTVSIDGMTCGACTSSVENALNGVDGLLQCNVSLLAERAIILHDPKILSTQQITTLIDDAGFDTAVISSEEKLHTSNSLSNVNLSLHGLRDVVAANALEDSLLEKPGIISASIDMATSRLALSYESSKIGVRSIVEIIEAAGYHALLSELDDTNAQLESLAKTKEIQGWKRAFLYSLSFAVPVFLINMILPMYLPMLDFGKLPLCPGVFLGDVLCLLLTIPVQFGIGKRFYVASFKSLKHRSPTMDVLIMMGTSAAFLYSCFTMLVAMFSMSHKRPSTVFDTSTMLITFITLGRWLENRAKGQTSAALSRLMSLAPSMTTIYDDPIAAEKLAEEWTTEKLNTNEQKAGESAPERSGPNHRVIPTELIEVGDIVVLHPGDKVSADGIVIRGESYVDESMITGEALPIHKKKGSTVIAGTVNGTSSIDFKVTRTGKDTQLSQIVKLVQNAQTSRAPIQRMADIVAGYFVPGIISLGLITFFGWMFVSHVLPHPPQIFLAEGSGGKVMVCLKLCISVIVFACPCALGLSTPTAVMVGTGVGAQQGILVKGGAVLEGATKINHVVFDKTGTLTTGKMTVAEARIERHWASDEARHQLWWLIVGLAEMNSEHPIGRAIHFAAKTESGRSEDEGLPGSLGDFNAHVGKGVSALVEPAINAERLRYRVFIGNATFLQSQGVIVPEAAATEDERSTTSKVTAGITQIHVAINNQFSGTVLLRDTVKLTAVAAVAALHRMGLKTTLITGDTRSTAISIASAVGIPQDSVHASASPSDKQSIIASMQESGDRVAMVGDGINDSPALATASIGIALASGTDVAMEAADIVLMRPDDLLSVPASLALSRAVFRRIKINLMWACLYNVIGLPFAMGLFLPFGGFMLPPMAAGAAMAASSISVVVSSLLLKLWKRPRWMDAEKLERDVQARDASFHGSRKNWWTAALSVSGSNGAAGSGWIGRTSARAWSTITGRVSKTSDVNNGYVPLQTVESAV